MRAFAYEPVHVDQPTAHLERSDRGVVLVFDDHDGTGDLVQQGPLVLRCRWHVASHDPGRPDEIVEIECRNAHDARPRSVTTWSTDMSCDSTARSSSSCSWKQTPTVTQSSRDVDEEPVVPAATLAEPPTRRREGESRHDHHIGPRRIDVVLRNRNGHAPFEAPRLERSDLRLADDRAEHEDPGGVDDRWQPGHVRPQLFGSFGSVVDRTAKFAQTPAEFGLVRRAVGHRLGAYSGRR